MATVIQSSPVRSEAAASGENVVPKSGGGVILTLHLSAEFDRTLQMLADRTSLSPADVINMAVGLLRVAAEATDEGKRVGIADAETELDTEFVGL